MYDFEDEPYEPYEPYEESDEERYREPEDEEEYGLDFSSTQQVSVMKPGGTNVVKRHTSPREAALDDSIKEMSKLGIGEQQSKMIYHILEKIHNIHLMNIRTLCIAGYYVLSRGKILLKKHILELYKTFDVSGDSMYDVLRYIKYIQKLR